MRALAIVSLTFLLSPVPLPAHDDHSASGLEVAIAEVTQLAELRVKTDKMRTKAGGEQEVVYEMRRPGKGNAFLNLRLYVFGDGAPIPITRDDLVLAAPGAEGERYVPFDWFHEDGLVERRGTSVTLEGMGILNFTTEVPEAGLRDLLLSVKGTEVGTLGEHVKGAPEGEGIAPSVDEPAPTVPEGTAEILLAEAAELSELRVKTDRMRTVDGRSEPVYELRKPGKGNLFLNVRVDVVSEGGPARFRKEDLAVVAGEESFHPFDWFREEGLKETRGETLTVPELGTLQFTIEFPARVKETAELVVKGRNLGMVANLMP